MQFILNADDFGKSPGRNEAVDAAFRQGLISSAGLIVTGKYVDDAVAEAIYTGVSPGNAAAKALYASCGFQFTGVFEDNMEEMRLVCKGGQ